MVKMATQYPMPYVVEARRPGEGWRVQRWYRIEEMAVQVAKAWSEKYPKAEFRAVKYPELRVIWSKTPSYYELEADRSKKRVARPPERKIEAFIPPEEAYQASYWGQFERFEKEALQQPNREVCVPTTTDELKKKYLELVKMREDPKIPYEERKKIAEQAREALDDLMKTSPNYGKFKKWREEQEQWRQVRAPGIDYSKVPEVFKTGIGLEAKKYKRF